MPIKILEGDCRIILPTMKSNSVDCIVTSPPYYGLRDYGMDGQIGLETSPGTYVRQMVEVFSECRRVLKNEGTLWLNLGDSYAGYHGNKNSDRPSSATNGWTNGTNENLRESTANRNGLKQKDLIGIPWRVAFALQADGWYLRQDIIWAKPNPMPESVTDRCTKSHEYIFLFSKSPRYYFDQESIAEPVTGSTLERISQPNLENQAGSDRVPGKTNGAMKAVVKSSGNKERKPGAARGCPEGSGSNVCGSVPWEGVVRNKRSVWNVATQPFKEAHFATFPPELIEPCIKAGCPEGGVVLDPFGGAGTTGLVADRLGRQGILIELNPAYAKMAAKRIIGDAPLFSSVSGNLDG